MYSYGVSLYTYCLAEVSKLNAQIMIYIAMHMFCVLVYMYVYTYIVS